MYVLFLHYGMHGIVFFCLEVLAAFVFLTEGWDALGVLYSTAEGVWECMYLLCVQLRDCVHYEQQQSTTLHRQCV